jgi:alkylated DNA repair dioxygenase AlkB
VSDRRETASTPTRQLSLFSEEGEFRSRSAGPRRQRGRTVTTAAFQRSLFAMGDPAVDLAAPFERLSLDDASWIDVARGFLRGADTLFEQLRDGVPWKQGDRWMYDRMVDDPRLSRWYTPDEPLPHEALVVVRRVLEGRYGVPLEGVGLNYYRDGRDSVASHRDRELRHLDSALVAILTLGARRPFLVRPRDGGSSIDLSPASGDLIVMGGACQAGFEHGIPKVAHAGPRISASYRWSSRMEAG